MATIKWDRANSKYGTIVLSATLRGGDTTDDAIFPDYSDKTIHVYGTFGSSTASVKGLNAVGANAQDLHRVNDPTLTFTDLAAETMALVLENPLIIRGSVAAGTGVITLSVVGKRNI